VLIFFICICSSLIMERLSSMKPWGFSIAN
jgi:hypothetical protein